MCFKSTFSLITNSHFYIDKLQVLAENENVPKAYFRRGEANIQLNDLDAAIEDFKVKNRSTLKYDHCLKKLN